MNNCQNCAHECHCEGKCNDDNCMCENCDCKDWPDNPVEVGHF